MIATVAVGTDGSGTAEKAVRSAIDLAERFGARIVFISAYSPVDEGRLRHEKRDAPEDVQWTINPEEDVDATLRDARSWPTSAAWSGRARRPRAIPPTCSCSWPTSTRPTCS